jgi:hypothetical protein
MAKRSTTPEITLFDDVEETLDDAAKFRASKELELAETFRMNNEAYDKEAALRTEFKAVKRILSHHMNNAEFQAAMEYAFEGVCEGCAIDEEHPSSGELYVRAIKHITIPCEKCHGTGVFSWGPVNNGQVAHSGDCYRCIGKGKQSISDLRRNYGYDNYAPIK